VGVYQRIAKLAPNARILVLGYPQLFPASTAEQNCSTLIPLFSRTDQNFFRIADNNLNQTISNAVSQSGVATFLPVAQEFAGHEVCGDGGQWLIGPSLHTALASSAFHPNAIGQQEYATIVNDYLTPQF